MDHVYSISGQCAKGNTISTSLMQNTISKVIFINRFCIMVYRIVYKI